MEHRCGTRYPIELEVYVCVHAGAVSSIGHLSNISLSGGFLSTRLPARPLARISLRLVDGQRRMGPVLEGHVIRQSAAGLGIEWSEYAPSLVRTLIGETSPAEAPQPESVGTQVLTIACA